MTVQEDCTQGSEAQVDQAEDGVDQAKEGRHNVVRE